MVKPSWRQLFSVCFGYARASGYRLWRVRCARDIPYRSDRRYSLYRDRCGDSRRGARHDSAHDTGAGEMNRLWLTLISVLIALPSWANNDPAEVRLQGIAAELRCLVCQNESIAASRADLAVDLRQQIREQIQARKTDSEIGTYMVDRYGDFVLDRPPLKTTTLLLWCGPMLLLVFGLFILATTLRRRRSVLAEKVLSTDELKRAQALLGQTKDPGK